MKSRAHSVAALIALLTFNSFYASNAGAQATSGISAFSTCVDREAVEIASSVQIAVGL